MSIDILKSELKAGVLRRLYLFYGPEDFLVRHYAGELEKLAVAEGARPFCVTVFDGKPAPGKVADACLSYPLMGERNFVVVKNAGLLKPSAAGKAGEAAEPAATGKSTAATGKSAAATGKSASATGKSAAGKPAVGKSAAGKPAAGRGAPAWQLPGSGRAPDMGFEELAVSLPAHACLLLIEDEVDRRTRLFMQISKHGLAVEFVRQKANDLAKWAAMVASRYGMRFEGAAMRRFMERAGDSMTEIRSELEKLVAYAQKPVMAGAFGAAGASDARGGAAAGAGLITVRDVDAVCSFPARARIFDLMDSVAERNRLKAAATLDVLFAGGEPAPRIMAMLSRHLIQLRQTKSLRERGMPLDEAAELMKMNPYRARILWRQCARFQFSGLDAAIQSCYEYDAAVKTGALAPNLAIEMLVASIE